MSLKWWQIRINLKQFSSNLAVFIFLSRDDPIVFNHEALKNRKESFDVIRNIDHLWTGLWYYRYCCYFFFSLGMENSKISLGNERNGSWLYKGSEFLSIISVSRSFFECSNSRLTGSVTERENENEIPRKPQKDANSCNLIGWQAA